MVLARTPRSLDFRAGHRQAGLQHLGNRLGTVANLLDQIAVK
jgi:hypothetical protein